MTDLITPAPALAVAGQLLRPLLAPIPVQTKMPEPRPDRIVLVRRPGGAMGNLVTDRPTLIFHCWALDDVDAEQIASRVRALLKHHQFALVGDYTLHGWREAGCSEHPDPAVTTHARWQVTGTLGISAH